MHISAVWGVVVERVSVCWLRRRRESTTHRVPGLFGLVESWVGCCSNVFCSFLPSLSVCLHRGRMASSLIAQHHWLGIRGIIQIKMDSTGEMVEGSVYHAASSAHA